MDRCLKHPRYSAKRRPSSKCRVCWSAWNRRNPNAIMENLLRSVCRYLPEGCVKIQLWSEPKSEPVSMRILSDNDVVAYGFSREGLPGALEAISLNWLTYLERLEGKWQAVRT